MSTFQNIYQKEVNLLEKKMDEFLIYKYTNIHWFKLAISITTKYVSLLFYKIAASCNFT